MDWQALLRPPLRVKMNLPWFIYVRETGPLITSKTIPENIVDSKEITLTETSVPGLIYRPVTPGGNGNRKISFTIPLLSRLPGIGLVPMINQLQLLRNQVQAGAYGLDRRFNPNPKVWYYWGVGDSPLPCIVAKVDFTHKGEMVNFAGAPQYSSVDIELIVDEGDEAYQMEETFRNMSSSIGTYTSILPDVIANIIQGRGS